jgi:hypothetical protein
MWYRICLAFLTLLIASFLSSLLLLTTDKVREMKLLLLLFIANFGDSEIIRIALDVAAG